MSIKSHVPKITSALIEINDVLKKRDVERQSQETNIFRILNVKNLEIKHASFLGFLLDPARNVELAYDFMRYLLTEIVNKYDVEDSVFDKIINGADFEVDSINGSRRYDEIVIDGGLKIDYAVELSVPNAKRVIVIEYKHNGNVTNNLEEYVKCVRKRYKNPRVKIHHFLIELGNKVHSGFDIQPFISMDNEVVVKACEELLIMSKNKDMMLTRSYIEQYVDILNPSKETYSHRFDGLDKAMWDVWNPSYADYGRVAEEKVYELINDNIDGVLDREYINDFYFGDLFSKSIAKIIIKNKSCNKVVYNSGWTRFIPEKFAYKDFYIWVHLEEYKNKHYIVIGLEAFQNETNDSVEAKQLNDYLQLLLENIFSINDHDEVDSLGIYSQVSLIANDGVKSVSKRKKNARGPFSLKFKYYREVDLDVLESISTTKKRPELLMKVVADLNEIFRFIASNDVK